VLYNKKVDIFNSVDCEMILNVKCIKGREKERDKISRETEGD
jgi:hypothetical protein